MSLSKPDTIEEDAAIARDDFVIAVWNGTLPQAVEQDMRSTPTTNGGNFYVDLDGGVHRPTATIPGQDTANAV